jgi:hypothetical protein
MTSTPFVSPLIPEIYNIINKNPGRNTALRRSLAIHTQGGMTQEGESWEQFSLKPIQPSGALSLILFHSDPMYSMGSVALRKQILVDKLLEIQGRADNELVGRRYPRKKIQDLLAGEVSANEGGSRAHTMLEEVLCELFTLQKVQLNRKTKTIGFFPPDVRNWVSDRPVIFSDDENCWLYSPTDKVHVLSWITEKEEQSWKIQWPTADGNMDVLKAGLDKRNLVARVLPGSDSRKVKKEDYARILGRAESIVVLGRISLVAQ